MPELPEVETTRAGLAPHLQGRCLRALRVRDARLRWPIPASLPDQLRDVKIEGIQRRSKYLLIYHESGGLLAHLGMSGSLRICPADEAPGRHDHYDLVLDNGKLVRYCDPRRFGCLLPLAADGGHELLDSLGPEPLGDGFDGALLYRRSRGRRVTVKQFLMDAGIVVGVGNIYANEALFLAGVRPNCPAGRISARRYDRIAETIRAVLTAAIQRGGTTLRDYVNGSGKPGYFQQQLNVYGRGGEPCRVCTAPLRESRLGQRTTVWCPACQR